MLFCDPMFIFREDGDFVEGMILSTQKEIYDESVSTCLFILLEGERKLSLSVESKHPFRMSILSAVHCLVLFSPSDNCHVGWCKQDGMVPIANR